MILRSFAGWIAVLAGIAATSVAMDANLSTTAFLVALGIAPGIVLAIVLRGTPSPSVGQMLYSAGKDSRL